MSERNEKIANRLKELRLKKNCTQMEIASAIGVSKSSYSMYEIGYRVPSDSVKIRIADFFKKSVQSIFY